MHKLLCLVLLCCMFFVTGCTEKTGTRVEGTTEGDIEAVIQATIDQISVKAIESQLKRRASTIEWRPNLRGVVVPHHLLVADLIADAFYGLNRVNPDLVVILAPNHSDRIMDSIYVAGMDVETYKGRLKVSPIYKELEAAGLAVVDSKQVVTEYGLTYLLPFVQNTGWDAEYLFIITARGVSTEWLEHLGATIEKEGKGLSIFWIASVDFSHGLPPMESRLKDRETKEWIENRNYAELLGADSEYLDNPSGLYLWLKAMNTVELHYQGESGSRSSETLSSTGTSYMIYGGYD